MASSENNTQTDQSTVTSGPGLTSGQSNTEAVQECYTPNILRYLQTGEGPRPKVNCRICYTRLAIPALHGHHVDNNVAHEEPHVLACGHLLGAACFLKWSLTQLANPGPRCPVCREPAFSVSAEVEAARLDAHVQLQQASYHQAAEEDETEESEEESEQEESEDQEPVSRATLRPAASTWPVLPPEATGLSDDEEED